jgi:hypothetical protein
MRAQAYIEHAMPTLEADFAEADQVLKEGGQESTWLDAFYQNAECRLLNLYDHARLIAWRIYDREEAATYWREQTEASEKILQQLERSRANAFKAGLPEIPSMISAIRTAAEIVQACRGSYELFS